ncbi:MAG: hypothetical protein PHR81_06770 [Bacteroidales bacterium]|nr:hypothetical protein [Bacteroidales bacterium]MDD4214498.1 hypothetical protein [Bacteroidales bacterium]
MKTYKFILLLIFALSVSLAKAQNNDLGRIYLNAYVPEQIEGLPEIAKSQLESKLSQIALQNGMGGSVIYPRFIISANVNVLTKDITSTAPAMIALTLEIVLYIGDGIEGKSFATHSLTVKGVDANENKAYISAIKNIKPADASLQAFIEKGKTKIIEYYNSRCDIIIKEAQTLASMSKYDEAIWSLTSVPDACTQCWNKCIAALGPIYQQKINYECKTKLLDATNVWNAGQNYEAAEQAGAILATIDPQASCINEAKALSEKISKRVYEIDKREWNFKYDQEIGLERDMIKAYRDVGVAYGNGQPKNVTVNYKTLW